VRRALPGGYELDDDRDRIDIEAVHAYITKSYWAAGRSLETMKAAVAGSARVIGLYAPDGSQAGFCRVVSDGAVFAYLADVFVLEEHRGNGRGVALVREAVDSEDWAALSWYLRTKDAHALYDKFGFGPTSERSLER
jgi:GNAT superfamily N-acetyltransferase